MFTEALTPKDNPRPPTELDAVGDVHVPVVIPNGAEQIDFVQTGLEGRALRPQRFPFDWHPQGAMSGQDMRYLRDQRFCQTIPVQRGDDWKVLVRQKKSVLRVDNACVASALISDNKAAEYWPAILGRIYTLQTRGR